MGLVSTTERYLFRPSLWGQLISYSLLPLTLIYCFIAWLRFKLVSLKDYDIAVVSIGNLVVGGSGKTPFTIAVAKKFEKSVIVLRGYKRKSSGLYVVSNCGEIFENVNISGDEAMLYAKSLPNSIVIVCEDRVEGIKKAKELGASIVFLDDGYGKHFIKKLDFILHSETSNSFCLPSGPYREKLWRGKEAIVLKEDNEYFRKVTILNSSSKMLLITAISKPWRLDRWLPDNVIDKKYFPDHYMFEKSEVGELFKKSGATSILTTQKDAVKLENFDLPLSIMELDIEVSTDIISLIKTYKKSCKEDYAKEN